MWMQIYICALCLKSAMRPKLNRNGKNKNKKAIMFSFRLHRNDYFSAHRLRYCYQNINK